jgi:hypothetical protein
MFTVLLHRVDERFHALAVRALFLLKIHDVEGIVEAYRDKIKAESIPFRIFLTEKKYHCE